MPNEASLHMSGNTLDDENTHLPTTHHEPSQNPSGPDTSPETKETTEAISSDKNENYTDTSFLDWDGPNDPSNPHNWPTWKKIFHSAIPAIYGFALSVPTHSL